MAKSEIDTLLEIEKEAKNAKRKKRIFRAKCTHMRTKKSKGLKKTGTAGVLQCDCCKTKVDLRPYFSEGAGIDELEQAVKVVKNALEIVKLRAARDEDKKSDQVAEKAAAMIIELDAVPELMKSLTEKKKDKDKKKEKKARLVEFGASGLSFGGKQKKGW